MTDKKECKFCEAVRKWAWSLVFVPLMFIILLPASLWGLLAGTAVLLLGKHVIKSESMENYGWNILISIDQLGNTITGGDPDETISSRSGKRQHEAWWAKALCWFLHILDTDHCKDAIEHDEGDDEIVR